MTNEQTEYKEALRKGRAARKAGNFGEALVQYQRAVSLHETDMNAMHTVAEIQLKLKRLVDAGKTYLAMAHYYAKNGFSLKAIAMYKKYFRIPINLAATPWTVGPKLELAAIYGEQGFRVKQAHTLLEVAEFLSQQANRYTGEALEIIATITDPMEEKLMAGILRDMPKPPEPETPEPA